jgi:hypothetical protein
MSKEVLTVTANNENITTPTVNSVSEHRPAVSAIQQTFSFWATLMTESETTTNADVSFYPSFTSTLMLQHQRGDHLDGTPVGWQSLVTSATIVPPTVELME